MPINGICHDFAFTRCYEEGLWFTTAYALKDTELWPKVKTNMKQIDPAQIKNIKEGVLTVVNPDNPKPSYCVHSYFVEDKKLISTNDPFAVYMGHEFKIVSVSGKIQAISYSVANFSSQLNINVGNKSAKIGKDERDLKFYWCSTNTVKTDWWKGNTIPKEANTGRFKWLRKFFHKT